MARSRRVGAVICALVVPLSAGCVRTYVGALASTPAAGLLPGATLSIGGQGYELVSCASGDRESFLGVDLADRKEQAILRLVVDPMEGPRLKVVVGGPGSRKSLALPSSSCRRLQARVEPTAWRANRVRDFSGFVDADCTSDTGIDVLARVRFTHCH
jgi:hypothetical protein